MPDEITTYNPFEGNRLGIDCEVDVASATFNESTVHVTFTDRSTRQFHHQWLRHCCYCAACGNAADGIRFNTVISFPSDITPAATQAANGDLVVTWPDGHESVYGADWLRHFSYAEQDRAARAGWKPTTWRAELSDDFPTVDWARATGGGAGHLELLSTLRDYGIVRVSDIGTDPEQTEELAALLGPIHETSVYGRMFDVRSEAVSKLGSKTAMAQAPHTDDAFYYSQPGIVVFHCLANTSEGGTSTYVDGFAIAAALAAEEPDAYQALTSLPIDHMRRHPGEIDLRSRGPLITLDENGQPNGIRYFDRALAPLDVAFGDVDRLYDALREYNQRLVDDEFIVRWQLRAGEAVLVDNHRIHHGRTAFDPAAPRWLRTCHVPRDEAHGRLRELARRYEPERLAERLPEG